MELLEYEAEGIERLADAAQVSCPVSFCLARIFLNQNAASSVAQGKHCGSTTVACWYLFHTSVL